MMKVRGDILSSLRRFVQQGYGVEGYSQWLDSLPGPSRKAIGPYLEVSRWYPVEEALILPLKEMCQLFYRGSLEGARDFGRHLSDHMSLGRRALGKLECPEHTIKREATALLSYFGPGEVRTPLVAPYMTIVQLSRFAGMSPVLENLCGGYLERAAERSGASHAQYEISSSLSEGAPFSELVVTWD